MSDIASLAIKIDSSQARTAQRDLQGMQRQGSTTERGMQSMTRTAARLGAALAAAFSFHKIVSEMRTATRMYADLERSQLRLTRQIELMGHQSIITAAEVEKMANRIDRATLMSAEGVRRAASMILTSQNITRESFERTMAVAVDMAEVFELDMATAARYLTRAMGDTTGAMTMFRRYGLELEESVQDQIKALQEAGRETEAYGLLLDALEGRVKGAAEAAGKGLAGALDDASRATRQLREDIGERLAPQVRAITNDYAKWADKNKELIALKIDEYLKTSADFAGQLWPHLQKIGEATNTTIKGFNSLPGWVQATGLIGALYFGKTGWAAVALIAATAGSLQNLNAQIANVDRRDQLQALIDQQLRRMETLQKQLEGLKGKEDIYGIGEAIEQIQARVKAYQDQIDVINAMEGSYKRSGHAAGEMADATNQAGTATDGLGDNLGDTADELEATAEQIDKVTAALMSSLQFQVDYAREQEYWAEINADVALAMQGHADTVEDLTEHYRRKKEMLTMTALEQDIYNAILRMGTNATTEQIKAVTEEIKAYHEKRKALEGNIAAEKGRTGEVRRQTTEIERIYDQMLRNIQSANASTFRSMMDDGIDSWESLGDRIIDIMKDTLAQILAMYAQQYIVMNIVPSFMGGGAGGSLMQSMGMEGPGGTTDSSGTRLPSSRAINWIQEKVPGMGWLGATIPGTGPSAATLAGGTAIEGGIATSAGTYPIGTTPGATWGGALGAGAVAGFGYQYLGGAIGLPQSQYSGLTAGVGGALGSAAGSYVAGAAGGALGGAKAGSVVPVIGTIIGAIIGGVLGSLMGGSGKAPRPQAWMDYSGELVGKKKDIKSADARNLLGPLIEGANAFEELLEVYGGALTDFGMQIGYIGHRGGEHSIRIEDEGVRIADWKKSEFEKLPWDQITGSIFEHMVKSAEFESENINKAIDNINFESVETAMADLSFAFRFDDTIAALTSGIEEMRQQIDAAAQQEVAGIIAGLEQQMETTKRLGLDTEALTEAQQEYVKSLVLGRETMTQAEAEMYALEARFREFEKALIAVGYSAEEAADIAAEGWERAKAEIEAAANAHLYAIADQARAQLAKAAGLEGKMVMGKLFDPMLEFLAAIDPSVVDDLKRAHAELTAYLLAGAITAEQYAYVIGQIEQSINDMSNPIEDAGYRIGNAAHEGALAMECAAERMREAAYASATIADLLNDMNRGQATSEVEMLRRAETMGYFQDPHQLSRGWLALLKMSDPEMHAGVTDYYEGIGDVSSFDELFDFIRDFDVDVLETLFEDDLAEYLSHLANAIADAAALQKNRLSLEHQLLQAFGATAEIRRRELEAVHETNRELLEFIHTIEDVKEAIQEAFAFLSQTVQGRTKQVQDRFNEEIQLYRNLEQSWQRIADSLVTTIEQLVTGPQSPFTIFEQTQFARNRYQNTSARARLGFVEAGEQLGGQATDYLQAFRSITTDPVDYSREFFKVLADLTEAEELAGQRADYAKIAADTLEEIRDEVIESFASLEYAINHGLLDVEWALENGFDSVEAATLYYASLMDDFVDGMDDNFETLAEGLHGVFGQSIAAQSKNLTALWDDLEDIWTDKWDGFVTSLGTERRAFITDLGTERSTLITDIGLENTALNTDLDTTFTTNIETLRTDILGVFQSESFTKPFSDFATEVGTFKDAVDKFFAKTGGITLLTWHNAMNTGLGKIDGTLGSILRAIRNLDIGTPAPPPPIDFPEPPVNPPEPIGPPVPSFLDAEQERIYNTMLGYDISRDDLNPMFKEAYDKQREFELMIGTGFLDLLAKSTGAVVARFLAPDAQGFADGGISTGPASGYLATLHGTEAIIPLNGGSIPVDIRGGDSPELIAEIKALRGEVSQLRQETRAGVRHQSDTSKYLQRWEIFGMPEEREEVTG